MAEPGPAGELTALPRPPSWIKGSLLLRKGGGKGVEGGDRGVKRMGEDEEMGRGRRRRREKEGGRGR